MTGSPAHVDGDAGGAFSAWDGYIFGRNLELIPDQCIVQAWEDYYLKPLNEYFKQQK